MQHVKLRGGVYLQTCTALVFEFFPMNLHDVRVNYGPLGSIDVKLYTWQLFRGQAHLEQVVYMIPNAMHFIYVSSPLI